MVQRQGPRAAESKAEALLMTPHFYLQYDLFPHEQAVDISMTLLLDFAPIVPASGTLAELIWGCGAY